MKLHAQAMIDFKTLALPASPNNFLVCPKNYCAATPQIISPTYSVSIETLQKAWVRMISSEPRVTQTWHEPDHHYQYVQRSLFFHFPDYIDVEFVEISQLCSTLAIYSRSKYGYYDFGVNKKRVQHWLKQLDLALKNSS